MVLMFAIQNSNALNAAPNRCEMPKHHTTNLKLPTLMHKPLHSGGVTGMMNQATIASIKAITAKPGVALGFFCHLVR